MALVLSLAGVLSAGAACPPTAGIDEVLGEGRVLLLGELHGTVESPAFVAAVACHALAKGLDVTIALELPQNEEQAVRDLLLASGPAALEQGIVELPFWAKDYQDGRTSQAMLGLLETLRELKLEGEPVELVLLDQPADFPRRDEEMATRLLGAFAESPGNFAISLTGNVHNRTVPGSGRMGARVLEALGSDRVVSLNVSYSGGSAWICEATAGCGPLELSGRGEGPGVNVLLFDEADARGFHGTYHVGAITASMPAKDAPASP